MPPKPLPKARPKAGGKPSGPVIEEIELGNVKIGKQGIVPVGEQTQQMPKTVNIDDLALVKELGAGAQGSVCLYRHKTTREKFAVKKISLHGKEQHIMKAVAGEVSTVFMEPSPYAIKLYNGFLRDGHLMLVMEYMDFGNLEELLAVKPRLPESAASYLAAQVVNGLAQLHTKQNFAGVKDGSKKRQIHRDIKPANILLSRRGDIKLADYGVAATADTIGVASFVGTQTYMSPERIRGQRYGTPSDIWSVGIVVAQALRGGFPFESSEKSFMALLKEVTTTEQIKLPSDCTAEAQSFIDACCRQDPEQRSTAQDLLKHPWITKYNTASSMEHEPPVQQPSEVEEFTREGSSIIPESPMCEGKSGFVSLLKTVNDSVTNRPQLDATVIPRDNSTVLSESGNQEPEKTN